MPAEAVPGPTPPSLQPASAAPAGWGTLAWQRIRYFLWLKAVGISLFCWVFFVAYFHLLRHPRVAPIEMPLTALDHAIAFNPWALGVYVSLWFYVGIPVSLQPSLRHAIVHGLWAGALCLAGLACFYLVPTAVPPLTQGTDLSDHLGFSVIQGVDAAGNACPSLHVATAFFSAIWIDHLFKELHAPAAARALNGIWFVLIAYSTLAIKQHVVLDVLAGMLLGGAFALASLYVRLRAPKRI